VGINVQTSFKEEQIPAYTTTHLLETNVSLLVDKISLLACQKKGKRPKDVFSIQWKSWASV